MNTYDIRLIVTDMDGTLLNSKQAISRENVSALQEARARGIRIAICSGRTAEDAGCYAMRAGLHDCAILALNGGYCLDKPKEQPYANRLLTDEALDRCVALLNGQRLTFGCFAQNRLIVLNPTAEQERHWGANAEREGEPTCEFGIEALHRARANGVNKIVYLEANEERLERMREKLSDMPGIEVTSSWTQNLEIMPFGVNKGAAVAELAQKLGFKATQVMTLGDYDNDASMIAYAGLGVAMGNATKAVREMANHVTLANDEHGVAAAIRRFALTQS